MMIGMGFYTHKDYAALQDKVVTDGVTRPSYEQRVKENGWMRNMDSKDGAWSTMAIFYNYRNDAGSEDYGFYNWKDPATFKQTKFGTTTYTSMDGVAGNGSTGRYESGWRPSTSTHYQLSNASICYDLLTNAAGVHLGANSLPSLNYNYVNGLTQITRINQDSATTLGPNNPGVGHWIMNKTTANADDLYKNGVLDRTTAVTQEATRGTSTVFTFCRNEGGTPNNYSACKIGYQCWGDAIPDPAKFHASLAIFKL